MFPSAKVYTWVELANPNHVYTMAGCIEQTNEERDLGVLIDNQLKVQNHFVYCY